MTHENPKNTIRSELGGPERDYSLPDATAIPVYDNPEDSFAPPMEHDLDDTDGHHRRPVSDSDEWGGRW